MQVIDTIRLTLTEEASVAKRLSYGGARCVEVGGSEVYLTWDTALAGMR